jgi:hypothetical protein
MRARLPWLAFLAVLAARLFAEAEPPMPPNAALKYWQAVALLPEDADERQERLFARPLIPEAADFVRSCGNSLKLLRQGTAIARCDWDSDASAGPGMLLPHLSKMRSLARAAVIVAQYESAHKEYQEALGGVFDVLALARHTGREGLLLGKLVEVIIANMALDVLASNLPALPPEVLKSFGERMAKLPRATTFAETMRAEIQVYGGWLHAKLPGATFQERMATVSEASDEEKEELRTVFADNAKLKLWLDQYDRLSQDALAILTKPVHEQQTALSQCADKNQGAGATQRVFIRQVRDVWNRTASMEARLLMLSAAVEVVLHGPQAADKHQDPFGAGAFQYAKRDEGFALTSGLSIGDRGKVELVVGEPQKPLDAPAKPPRPPTEKGDF